MTNFSNLGLNQDLCEAIAEMGFVAPSEIQQKALPVLLNQKTDFVGLAQTGTGKTAAFGLPLLQNLNIDQRVPQGLILSPTRELCKQITDELIQYAKKLNRPNIVAIYGGASMNEQKRQINAGAHIVVATPGRLKDMLERRLIDLSQIGICVLDEADEMLNMGFYDDLIAILKYTPAEKNTWLFSATMPREVTQIAKDFMSHPVEVTVGAKNESTKNVSHEYYTVNPRARYSALKRLIDAQPDIFSVIFCRTRRNTQKVAERLSEEGYNAAALHGDLSQNQRDVVMKSFRNRHLQLLVATDVAARGIDVDDITHVIHYQLPDETEVYTHRSGRTGRAGNKGISMVLATRSEKHKLKRIEKTINQTFEEKQIPVPENIIETRLLHQVRQLKNNPVGNQIDPYLPLIKKELEDLDKETLLKKIFSLEINRLETYYAQENQQGNLSGPQKKHLTSGTRFFISLGRKDGFNNDRLRDFILNETQLDSQKLLETDVKGNFSFFNIVSNEKDKLLSIFENYTFQGRQVTLEVAKDAPSRGERRKHKGKKEGKGNRRNQKNLRFKGGRRKNIQSSVQRRRKRKK